MADLYTRGSFIPYGNNNNNVGGMPAKMPEGSQPGVDGPLEAFSFDALKVMFRSGDKPDTLSCNCGDSRCGMKDIPEADVRQVFGTASMPPASPERTLTSPNDLKAPANPAQCASYQVSVNYRQEFGQNQSPYRSRTALPLGDPSTFPLGDPTVPATQRKSLPLGDRVTPTSDRLALSLGDPVAAPAKTQLPAEDDVAFTSKFAPGPLFVPDDRQDRPSTAAPIPVHKEVSAGITIHERWDYIKKCAERVARGDGKDSAAYRDLLHNLVYASEADIRRLMDSVGSMAAAAIWAAVQELKKDGKIPWDFNWDGKDMAHKLSDDDEEAWKILEAMRKSTDTERFRLLLTLMASMNITGPLIALAYEQCGNDMERFKNRINSMDPALVQGINGAAGAEGYTRLAVPDGATSLGNFRGMFQP